MCGSSTHDLLVSEGYRLVEDVWQTDGRKSYVHDDSADRYFVSGLSRVLRAHGWRSDKTRLRMLRKETTGELIEIEPGGSETSGHFLHHLKSD